MIIITQNRDYAYEVKEFELSIEEWTNNDGRTVYHVCDKHEAVSLGSYNTKEMAKEILLGIVDAFIKDYEKIEIPE